MIFRSSGLCRSIKAVLLRSDNGISTSQASPPSVFFNMSHHRKNLAVLVAALTVLSFLRSADAFGVPNGFQLTSPFGFPRHLAFGFFSQHAYNVSVIFCNSENGCVTDDGWQVSCPAQQPVMKQMVKLLKVYAVRDYYIVVQTMTLPQAALGFAIGPEDSPLQEIPPNARKPEDIDDIPRSKVDRNRFLASRPRCTRIPPGVFRDGRWFPHGMPFGMCCKHRSFFKNSRC